MATGISIDTSTLISGIAKAVNTAEAAASRGVKMIADEILRLSQFEVPHDTGLLQNSGHTESDGDGQIVGYNKVYAARLHENPQYRFQKGRKGKYLEDPIKRNLSIFTTFLQSEVKGSF